MEILKNNLEECLDFEEKLNNNYQNNTFGQYLADLTDDDMYNALVDRYGVSHDKAESWIRDSKPIRDRVKKSYSF